MNPTACVALRIFTGPHAGTEILLESGACIIGTDDTCDIILRDKSVAPQHLRLLIEQGLGLASDHTDSAVSVRVFPLEGQATVQEEALKEGQQLRLGAPCFLGYTCFALALPEQSADMWAEVQHALQPLLAPQKTAGTDNKPKAQSAPLTTNEAAVPTNLAKNHARPAASPAQRAKVRWLRRAPLIFVLLLLVGLSLNVGSFWPVVVPSPDLLRQKLAEVGLDHLEIVPENGVLLVRGTLPSDKERGTLVRVVQRMQYPVRLQIEVGNDMEVALTAALNNRGLYPKVLQETVKGEKHFKVMAYMKDSTVEDWALAGAREDLSFLHAEGRKSGHRMSTKIVYAPEVDMALSQSLSKAGLNEVSLTYWPGTVEIAGDMTPEKRKALDKAVLESQSQLGVPLQVTVTNKAPNMAPAAPTPSAASVPALPTRAAPKAQGNAGGGFTFKVVGVTMQPMSFIALESGERIFIGGELPGGHILESITTTQLVLSRHGQSIIYPLRGSK